MVENSTSSNSSSSSSSSSSNTIIINNATVNTVDNNDNAICGQNKTSVNRVCVCDQFSIPSEGGCFRCVAGSFKDGNICHPCSHDLCVSCTSNVSCDACASGYALSEDRKSCIIGVSTETCGAGFYNNGTNCLACPASCFKCKNGTSCDTCAPTYVFNSASLKCEPPSVALCPPNQILIDGVCECNSTSTLQNGACVSCT